MEATFLSIFGFVPSYILILGIMLKRFGGLKYDLFEPLTLILFSTFLGVTLRTIYIVFTDSLDHYNLLIGYPTSILFNGLFLICLGVGLLVAGYIIGFGKKSEHIHSTIKPAQSTSIFREWDSFNTGLIVFVLCVLAIIGIFLFIRAAGFSINSITDISTKRALFIDGTRISLGYHRWLASLGGVAFYIALIFFLSKRKPFFSLWGFLVLISGITAFAFPFITSVREEFFTFLISGLIILYYLGSRKTKQMRLPIMKVASIVCLLIIFIMIMTGLRERSDDFKNYLSFTSILENVVGSGNFFGVAKTSLALEKIPSEVDFLYGKSLMTWLVAPVPRKIWPEKPQSLDYLFGSEVYGQSFDKVFGGGRPPGFLVELYWNFGIIGTIIGMFLYGYILAIFYRKFHPLLLNKDKTAILLYVVLVHPLTMVLIGSDLSKSIIDTGTSILPIVLILGVITVSRKKYFNNKSSPNFSEHQFVLSGDGS